MTAIYKSSFDTVIDGELVTVVGTFDEQQLEKAWQTIVSQAAAVSEGIKTSSDLFYDYKFQLSDYIWACDRASITDYVELEALALAEADITSELAKDGLPPPKSIRDHARTLVRTNTKYYDRAKARIAARAQVARELLAESA